MEIEKAYFAGGCFWCLEASFKVVPGVINVINGYTGGTTEQPIYEQVASGTTGHAETVEIEYDPKILSYQKLLNIFFKIHDPSQKDRQGNDIGTQYRSAIFYLNDKQKREAEGIVTLLSTSGEYSNIYTVVQPLTKFWPAEEYRQDYFAKHPDQAYCQVVVQPKVEKTIKYLHDNNEEAT